MRLSIVFLLFCAGFPALLPAQRAQSGLSGGLSSNSSGTIFYIDPMINERMLGSSVADLSELLADYRLRPGDIVSLGIRGGINIVVRAALINASGEVTIPEVGPVKIAGLKMDEATSSVQEAVSKVILNAKAAVSLERPAPPRIHFSGISRFEGSVQIEAPKKLLDLLVDYGAVRRPDDLPATEPDVNLRDIEVIDLEGRSVRYDVFPALKGLQYRQQNPYIFDGFKVILKPRGDSRMDVSISGAVVQPQQIPWHPDDTVEDLIYFASGFKLEADSSNIMILSQNESAQNGIGALNSGAYKTLKMQRGDNVIVGFKSRNTFGKVRVIGEANRPGIFPVEEGKTSLADVLEFAGGLNEHALKNAVIIVSKEVPSIFEKPVKENQTASASGKLDKMNARKKESSETTDLWKVPPGYRLPLRAGGSTASLQRGPVPYFESLDYLQLEATVYQNRRVVDLSSPDRAKTIFLSDGDAILLPYDDGHIQVLGQVNNPGLFPRQNGASAKDYIEAAGGKTAQADDSRVFVLKAGSLEWKKASDTSVEPGDAVFVDRTPLKSYEANRLYELQKKQFFLSLVSTVFGAITTLILITNL